MKNIRNIFATLCLAILLTGCPPPGGEEGGGNPLITFLPFILIFVFFYLLILRPQQKQSKQRKQMLAELKRGDDVVTSGGIYGKILNISEDDVVTLEISKGMSIRVTRSAMSGLQPAKDETKTKEEKSK